MVRHRLKPCKSLPGWYLVGCESDDLVQRCSKALFQVETVGDMYGEDFVENPMSKLDSLRWI